MRTLKDLNKHLFEQLDRLANADKDNLELEVQRAETMQVINTKIIKANNT